MNLTKMSEALLRAQTALTNQLPLGNGKRVANVFEVLRGELAKLAAEEPLPASTSEYRESAESTASVGDQKLWRWHSWNNEKDTGMILLPEEDQVLRDIPESSRTMLRAVGEPLVERHNAEVRALSADVLIANRPTIKVIFTHELAKHWSELQELKAVMHGAIKWLHTIREMLQMDTLFSGDLIEESAGKAINELQSAIHKLKQIQRGEGTTIDQSEGLRKSLLKAINFAEQGWSIIANVSSGNWDTQRADWREAAMKHRDLFHTKIRFLLGVPPKESPAGESTGTDCTHANVRDVARSEPKIERGRLTVWYEEIGTCSNCSQQVRRIASRSDVTAWTVPQEKTSDGKISLEEHTTAWEKVFDACRNLGMECRFPSKLNGVETVIKFIQDLDFGRSQASIIAASKVRDVQSLRDAIDCPTTDASIPELAKYARALRAAIKMIDQKSQSIELLVLQQIIKGPVEDGNLASKLARDKLVQIGLVRRFDGKNILAGSVICDAESVVQALGLFR